MKKKITIFGSTGSIGDSTLDLVKSHPEKYEIVGLTINNNYKKLIEQVNNFNPKIVSINNTTSFDKFKEINLNKSLKVVNGNDCYDEILAYETDIVVAAITGSAGLMPVVKAAKKGISIALANKESLVCSGSLITSIANKNGSIILPVDSEHNAIFQVLDAKNRTKVSKLILTASGGPFLNIKTEDLINITPEQAIKHPNWSMGKKISVDSATMMNKGLELIEAHYLFEMPYKKIDVIIHPESIIHSCVEYADGSILSQMGTPDMRIPISYVLAYPDRISNSVKKLELGKVKKLTFLEPDLEKFPCLELAYESLKIKKSAPTILNAANEVAVDAFLSNRIKYLSIPKLVEKTLNKASFSNINSIKDVLEIDKDARQIATSMVISGKY
jgi:1-deoxy-D-xylulose-5-phosphate reductoisomerase